MKFWFIFGWVNGVFAGRAYSDVDLARAKATTYNAVLVEVHVCEVDLQTYVAAHDYEYQNKNGESEPVQWADETAHVDLAHGWVAVEPPFVRVGKDISAKRYREEHGEHG